MIQKVLVWFIQFGPSTKRWFWRKWYNAFANKSKDHSFRFMNYGYAEDGFHPEIPEEDKAERYPIQLYHHTSTQIELSGKKLLEVGCGRGGGASYIQRQLRTESVVGMDISESAIKLCRSSHEIDGLEFVVGDSESIPSEKETFDAVLNVESSHCYGNLTAFLSEVQRVLNPGGVLLWCDFRSHNEMKRFFKLADDVGLALINQTDITKNILDALDLLTPGRKEQIDTHVPKIIRNVFKSYAGLRGSSVHNAFLAGELVYKSAVFQKEI